MGNGTLVANSIRYLVLGWGGEKFNVFQVFVCPRPCYLAVKLELRLRNLFCSVRPFLQEIF
jgi:hypothetical protein